MYDFRGTNLLYVPNFTLCVPFSLYVSHRILVFFLNTNFYRKNTFLRVFRFAEHESDVVFSIYGISTNIGMSNFTAKMSL